MVLSCRHERVFCQSQPVDKPLVFADLQGVWLAVVTDRLKARAVFALDGGRREGLVRMDMIEHQFLLWADEVLARTILRVK